MRSRYLFLLLYLLGSSFGQTNGTSHGNGTCTSRGTCGPDHSSSSSFLTCVGLPPPTDSGRGYVHRLKSVLEALMDVYTFMRNSVRGVPILSLQGELTFTPDPMQNQALVQMWLEVKMVPLLKSITKNFLTCLSTKTFSCSTYQTVVKEISLHYSEMDPVRQKWIYSFFMVPFLSGDRVAGCVSRNESSEAWLLKNFGAFRGQLRLKDFSSLDMVFSGLGFLELLTPAQKAELLMMPGVAGLDNGTLTLIFNNLLTGGPTPSPLNGTAPANNWTTPGHNYTSPGSTWPTHSYSPISVYEPSSPHPPSMGQVVSGFMTAFKPISSFVHEFVSFTHERNVSEIRSTTLTQFLLNWTLSELADQYRPKKPSVAVETLDFDVTDPEDWYRQVVMPLLRRFLPNSGNLMHDNITLAFHQLFYLDHPQGNQSSEIQDVCSLTLDQSPCGLTDMVQTVAEVLHCAAQTKLRLDEKTVEELIIGLIKRLNSLIRELATTNFHELGAELKEIFTQPESPALTQQHLQDPEFIRLWFRVKLLPLMPDVAPPLLSCLSTKNFSCPVYQALVAEMSKHMSVMDEDDEEEEGKFGSNMYKHFILPFMMRNDTADPHCLTANGSAEWLERNFGYFSRFASMADFYMLNPNFTGLDVLHLLVPKQLAEMLLLPPPAPPGKEAVIDAVFNFLLESPEKMGAVFDQLPGLARMVDPPCAVYKQIFERMYGSIMLVPADVEPEVWAGIDSLMKVAPPECVPANITCPATQFNASRICSKVDSSDVNLYLNTSSSMTVSCNFTLDEYACAKLDNFSANQLVSLLKCNLPGNSSHSKALWKLLLTKVSMVLDPALDMMANMSMVGPSASQVLDVIGEMRVSILTDEQLMNDTVIRKWFSQRLSGFLPSASGIFLRCLSHRNLTCWSYQQILLAVSVHFDNMTLKQQQTVLKSFILPVLTLPPLGPGCVNGSNSSTWLMKNLGPFSKLLSLEEILQLNPLFNPLEVIPLLTPKQSAELVLSNRSAFQDKSLIIDKLFDFYTTTEGQKELPEFLFSLTKFVQKGDLSCPAYRTLFTRLDMALVEVPVSISSNFTYTKVALSEHLPPDCIIYGGNCSVTVTNETDICMGVNSTELQLLLNSGNLNGSVCEFSAQEFACASLSALTAEHLAALLMCNHSSNTSQSRSTWKLLLSKASGVLNQALDLLGNKTLDPNLPALPLVLDSIREIRLDLLDNPALIQLWFNRLRPFLSVASRDFLSCLAAKDMNCSTYQHIVQIFSQVQPIMTMPMQTSVVQYFIKGYLMRNDTADPGCSSHTNDSGEWLQKNLGAFSGLLSFSEIQMLNTNFSAMEALPQMTVEQLAQMSSTPGQLRSAAQVDVVMDYVPSEELPDFFDTFSPATMAHVDMMPSEVMSAMLQVVFDQANLSSPNTSDSVVTTWLHMRMRPLVYNLAPRHAAPFFQIIMGRNCSVEELGVMDLNDTISSLSEESKSQIHDHIILMLKGPKPIQCYGNNFTRSFYDFLQSQFMGFQFPNLTSFLSLMPPDDKPQLLNSMPPSDLGDYLRLPDIVDNDAELCEVYKDYTQTPDFLETEPLPESVRRPTLPCVWPTALASSNSSEVDAWFDRRLTDYLQFLTKDLISTNVTYNSSCLAFQNVVSVLTEFNYTAADFEKSDVYASIRAYLTSASAPRCYNSSDPELNSTAWFVEYMGPFVTFLTLADLQAFGSAQVIQVFTVNIDNIALFNYSSFPLNLTSFYTTLVYQEDENFNPVPLPLSFRCFAPGQAFAQLTKEQSMVLLTNISDICTDLDPTIAAALAGNFGDDVDSGIIIALGNESSGLSTGQLKNVSAQELLDSLSILGGVDDWNQGQAKAIIQAFLSSGMMEITNSSSLLMLGSLVMGLPTSVLANINGSQLLNASDNAAFLVYLSSGPSVLLTVFVSQIITVNSSSEEVIENVPDEMASEIPRTLLLDFSNKEKVIRKLNKKRWRRKQVELFFSKVAVESVTDMLGGVDKLTSPVLQGFTCTGVKDIPRAQVIKLIKTCRRTGDNKVNLEETQLTCMYIYIKTEPDVSSFDLYPHDVLLYYDYSLVNQSSCRSYFQQLSTANFYVFSSALSYKVSELFDNARSCLGITSTNLTKDNIDVLGNMCCTLDGSYMENSDPSILDKLKYCQDFSDTQAAAIQALMLSGRTQYGDSSTWDEETLLDLGLLPLFMTSDFYEVFDKGTKRAFLEDYRKVLNEYKIKRKYRRRMKKEIRKSIRKKAKRSTGCECSVGTITQVTVSDSTFPFDYDTVTQFNCCLSTETVKNTLDAITDKVDDEEYLAIVLAKLDQAYADDATIPEDQVQVLGPASRVATQTNINKWTITELDTLSSLMDSSDGDWDLTLAKAVISKYLGNAGNNLGSTELNVIGGSNLCGLDLDVLENISQQSIKDARALDIPYNCTTEKKVVFFKTAELAFSPTTRTTTVSPTVYELMKSYLGGASVDYVKTLASSNISMDMATFTSLNESVILNLNVNEVKNLLGTNVADLKSYENQTTVQSWIRSQSQDDLDTLGLDLTGGRVTSTTTTPVTSSPSSSTTATASTSTAATTSSAGTTTSAATSSAGTTASAATSSAGTTTSAATSLAGTTASAATSSAGTTASAATTSSAGTTASAATTSSAGTTTSAATTSSAGTTASAATTSSVGTTASAATTSSAGTTASAATTSSAGTTASAATTSSAGTTAPGATTSSAGTTASGATTSLAGTTATGATTSSAGTTASAATTSAGATTSLAPTSATVAPTTTAAVTSTTASSASTTTGHGSRIRADAGFSVFFLFVLLVVSQHVVM